MLSVTPSVFDPQSEGRAITACSEMLKVVFGKFRRNAAFQKTVEPQSTCQILPDPGKSCLSYQVSLNTISETPTKTVSNRIPPSPVISGKTGIFTETVVSGLFPAVRTARLHALVSVRGGGASVDAIVVGRLNERVRPPGIVTVATARKDTVSGTHSLSLVIPTPGRLPRAFE